MRGLAPVALALVLAAPTSAVAYTFLSGNLPATLTAAQSPYVALSDLLCGTCAIEPGVVIFFTSNTGISLGNPSNLQAIGTQDSPIRFEGYLGASWHGIWAPLGYGVVVELNHCRILNAQRGIYSSPFGGFDMTVRNCEINAASGEAGIWLEDSDPTADSSVLCEDTVVTGGSFAGVFLATGTGDSVALTRCSATDSPGMGIRTLCSGIVASQIVAQRDGTGVALASGSLTASTLSENGTGIAVSASSWSMPVVENCTITGNGTGVAVPCAARFTACTILGNTSWDVYCTAPIQQITTIDMRDCYWGPTTTQEMVAEGTFSDISTIYDWWDDHRYSLIDYSGFLGPVAVAQPTWQTWGRTKAAFR